MHDIRYVDVTALRDLNMANADVFALHRSGLNEFLYAPVGTESNGMTLSVISVFARLGNDPWLEAGRLAKLPKSEATESLARSIASVPRCPWSLQAATAIAVGLIPLLPLHVAKPGSHPSESAIKRGRFLRIVVVLVCVACVIAFEVGIPPAFDVSGHSSNSVANLAPPPR